MKTYKIRTSNQDTHEQQGMHPMQFKTEERWDKAPGAHGPTVRSVLKGCEKEMRFQDVLNRQTGST